MKDKQLAELEEACLELFHAHHLHYRWLKKYGPNMFEDDSTLLTSDGRKQDGRIFILKTLAYFEIRDEPVCYRMCAIIKRALDCYDERFKITTEQKLKLEEQVLAYKLKQREQNESVEKIHQMVRRNKVSKSESR
jgi:hypothetical protein